MENTSIAVQDKPVNTGISVFDSGQFQQMWAVAGALSKSSLVPETLKGKTDEETNANCLRVVEQASRWGLSPFAVMDCASVIHGKLMWEGKLVAAALEATLGIRLNYSYTGEGMSREVTVSGQYPGESEARTITGNVKDWKSAQWKAEAYDQRLAYRGAREWTRRHAASVILGVYSPDEFEESEMRQASGRVIVEKGEVHDIFAKQNTGDKEQVDSVSTAEKSTAPERANDGEAISKSASEKSEASPTPPQSSDKTVRLYIGEVKEDSGKTNDKPWNRFDISLSDEKGQEAMASTFSSTQGNLARSLTGDWAMVTLEKKEGKPLTLISIEAIEAQPNLLD